MQTFKIEIEDEFEEPAKSVYGEGYSFKQGYERQFMIKCEDDGTCDPVKYQKYKDL